MAAQRMQAQQLRRDVGSFESPLADAAEDGIALLRSYGIVDEDIEVLTREAPNSALAIVRLIAQREAQMEAKFDAKISAALNAQVGGETAQTLESTVRGLVAHSTETPTNFHQATAFYAASHVIAEEVHSANTAHMLYFGSVVMILGQCMAAAAICLGILFRSCVSSDQCGDGYWCTTEWTDRCHVCANQGPFGSSDLHRAAREKPDFDVWLSNEVSMVCSIPYTDQDVGWTTHPAAAVRSWCESCLLNDGSVDMTSLETIIADNVESMGLFDVATLIVSAFVVAFSVVGELKDIRLCSLAISHNADLAKTWIVALRFLGTVRQFVFLPLLMLTVPYLVVLKGGDALSICMNSVAVLFLCEIDNLAFTFGLGEHMRSRVEEAGRVILNDVEAKHMVVMKELHVTLLVLFQVLFVLVAPWFGSALGPASGMGAAATFWLASVIEKPSNIGHTTLDCLCGLVVCAILLMSTESWAKMQ